MDVLASFGTGRLLLVWAIIAICLLLMLVILVQKGRGSGLSGAFGGGSLWLNPIERGSRHDFTSSEQQQKKETPTAG